ncbi:MAG: hypothetical protein WCI65_03715, partial [Synechococcaceae cyanobacterium ELA263]
CTIRFRHTKAAGRLYQLPSTWTQQFLGDTTAELLLHQEVTAREDEAAAADQGASINLDGLMLFHGGGRLIQLNG